MRQNLAVGRVVLLLAIAGVFGFSIGAGTAVVTLWSSMSVMAQDAITNYICFDVAGQETWPSGDFRYDYLVRDRSGGVTPGKSVMFCTPVRER